MVIPEEEVVMGLAKAKGWEGDFKTLCEGAELKAAVEAQMAEQAVNAKLNSLEQVKGNFALSHVPWLAVPAEILTSTQKLRRHKAQEYYMATFDKLYA